MLLLCNYESVLSNSNFELLYADFLFSISWKLFKKGFQIFNFQVYIFVYQLLMKLSNKMYQKLLLASFTAHNITELLNKR